MSDELDKFVLQYTVDLKDAVSRLEQLNNKIEKVGKDSDKTKGNIKEFAKGTSEEIGKLVPGIEKVSTAIKMLGAEFAIAGIAVGAIGIGIKSVMDMRAQYNQQRKDGMDIGVSELRMEEYQRKFVKASGGNITRQQTAEELKKLSEFSAAVYRDPTRIGTESRTAKVLGIDMGAPGQHVSTNALVQQLGEKFSKMTDSQVQAQAKILGLNQDFALGLKKQGASVGQITELTPDEIKNRKVAQDSLTQFNAQFAKLEDNFKKAENVLGEQLLPAFTKFVQMMSTLTDALPKNIPKIEGEIGNAANIGMRGMPLIGPALTTIDAFKRVKDRFIGKKDQAPEDPKQATAVTNAANSSSASAKANDASAKTLKELVDGQVDDNEEAKRIADQEALAINQFAGAVASFSNAIDDKQAWAAWAGEVGKAAGLGGDKNAPDTQSNQNTMDKGSSNPADSRSAPPVIHNKYDQIFEEAGKKNGVDPTLLKNIAKVESGFNPNATSGVGAKGLMQIMPANFKSLGITDPTDPTQNVMGGAKLFSKFLKRAKGDVEKALMMYHGGFDTNGWGALTKSYPGKVLGAKQQVSQTIRNNSDTNDTAPNQLRGESRSKIQLKSVQNNIAQRLGVPVGQLQLGGVNRGDVSFASSQIESGIQNNIYDLKNQLKAVNLPQQTMSKMISEIRAQESGLAMMRQYSGQVIDKSQPGERSITIGERAIVINVNGTTNPEATALSIQNHLNDHLSELVNGTANGMKR